MATLENYHEGAKKKRRDASDAFKAARVAYDAAMVEARSVLSETYRDVFLEDNGNVRSDVPEVMAKLVNFHRGRCTKLFGL